MKTLLKRLCPAFLALVFVLSLYVPSVTASDPTDEVIADLDFDELTTIANKTFPNGVKAALNPTGNGWLPTNSELKKEADGTQVLRYQRLDDALAGFDVSTLGTHTGKRVVCAVTMKYDKIDAGGFFQIGFQAVDASGANGKWYFSLAVTDGGRVVVDYQKSSATVGYTLTNTTEIGTISQGEYHTLSVAYDLANNKQEFYIDGVKKHEISGFRQNCAATRTGAPANIYRFKFESLASDADLDLSFRNVKISNEPVVMPYPTVAELDFSTMTEIKAPTFANGAKSILQATGNGWLPTNAELKDDNGTQVLHFQRLSDELCGFDFNTLGALTGKQVMYSVTLKYDRIDAGGYIALGAVGCHSNGSTGVWYWPMALTSGGKVVVDFQRSSGQLTETTEIGTVSPGEYHTLSYVLDLENSEQRFYIDGDLRYICNKYRINYGTAFTTPGTVYRFKFDVAAANADIDLSIKKVGVYNAEAPDNVNHLRLIGTQETAVSGGKYDIRFVGALDAEAMNFDSIGMRITAANGENTLFTKDLRVNTVYSQLTAKETDTGRVVAVTAESKFSEYLYGIVIANIPASLGTVEFTVTLFGEKSGAATDYRTYTVTYNAGEFVPNN